MFASAKRKQDLADNANNVKRSKRDPCPHKENCYRRNPHHFKEYDHPHLQDLSTKSDIPSGLPQPKSLYIEQIEIMKSLKLLNCDDTSNIKSVEKTDTSRNGDSTSSKNDLKNKTKLTDSKPSTSKAYKDKGNLTIPHEISNVKEEALCTPGSMLEKLKNAEPYNLFFTTIPKSAATLKHPTSITFTDLLCPSLGVLKCSLQINFMIDAMWLMEQYQARNQHKKPLTILYGSDDFPKMKEYMDRFLPNVTHSLIKMKDPFGVHHSKVGIYVYEDKSLRIVVSTANLYYEDWNHYNQGLWLSPKCPRLPEDAQSTDGESVTGFKMCLKRYLQHYSLPCLKEWIDYVDRADFSAVRVFLVTSVPGKHYPKGAESHLYRVADLLSRHCSLPSKTTPDSEGPLAWGINAQASSIGSLGKSPADWLRSCLLRSLSAHKNTALTSSSNATLNVIFPSVDNVMNGYFGPESGGCLPYSKQINEKQRWFQTYLHQWKADKLQRTRAMPHIKTYCRVSPCLSKLAWFLLTSSNLSKSAWGGNIQRDSSVYVRSYEMGVMFLPAFFDEEYFEISNTLNSKNKKLFPFMYDLPLTSYRSDDYPWCN